jgi:hypothetical protein
MRIISVVGLQLAQRQDRFSWANNANSIYKWFYPKMNVQLSSFLRKLYVEEREKSFEVSSMLVYF